MNAQQKRQAGYGLPLLLALLAVGLVVFVVLTSTGLFRSLTPGGPAPPKSPPLASGPVTSVATYRNVVYATVDGKALDVDIFAPTSGTYPAVVLVHGGGHAVGNKSELDAIGLRIARVGFVAFNIDYRLAPPGGRWHVPAESDDVHTAVTWVRANGARYHASTTLVGALGSSAGGNLVMMAATTGTKGQDRVDVAVSLSGPSAYDLLPDDANGFTGAGRPKNLAYLAGYLDCTVEQITGLTCPKDRVRAASPAYHVDASSSPIFIANSTDELTPLNQAQFMASQMDQAHVPHVPKIVQGQQHARAYIDQVWDDIIPFLKSYLTG